MCLFVAIVGALLLCSARADPVKLRIRRDGESVSALNHRRVEDFFWTGSGDGPAAPERAAILASASGQVRPEAATSIATPAGTKTIVSTTTLLATLYLEPPGTNNATIQNIPCTLNCGGVVTPAAGTIRPTKTLSGSEARYPPLDRRYWLLTILATNAAPDGDWEAKLAALYTTAFARQLERHLGLLNRTRSPSISTNSNNTILSNKQTKRSTNEQVELIDDVGLVFKREIGPNPQVQVYVHNVSADTMAGRTELLYTVMAGGRPVLAETAAEDMRLVTDEEAASELGYPILTKSEPYLRGVHHGSTWGERSVVRVSSSEPWLIAAVAIATCVLLLMLVALIVIAAQKRNSRSKSSGEQQGKDNEAFVSGEAGHSKTENILGESSIATISKDVRFSKRRSVSSASGDSIVDSPSYLPRRRLLSHPHNLYSQVSPKSKQQSRFKSKQKTMAQPKKRRNHNAVAAAGGQRSRELDYDRSSSDQASGDALVLNKPSSAGSIGSFLSLPSVRSFPRCDAPEPLTRILEPTSVYCLDWEGDSGAESRRAPGLVRHLSMSAADPNVMDQVVWKTHCKRIETKVENKGVSTILPTYEGGMEHQMDGDIRQTQRRYRQLIDGAIELWNEPAADDSHDRALASLTADHERSLERNNLDTVRGRSAIVKSNTDESAAQVNAARPRSAAPRRLLKNDEHKQPPSPSKKAWGSGAPSPLVRPLSAGPFHRPPSPPRVDVARVVAPDPEFPQNNDANVAPLLAAIRKELHKFTNTSDA